ncbi:MAG: DAK2 domain-containing protein [Agathobacter sp.]|nr:DAK2 domain-containing protein [Agathobacter sp.]
MQITSINSEVLAKMFLAGAKNLDAKKEWINELNVFPVPDGDTGTNMTMTIMSAAREVSALGATPQMAQLAKAISSGSLRGARGNSGVILSQLFRGFCKVIAEYDEIDVCVLCDAMQKAIETAYKAVMKPKEGTILTVAKGAADKALELVDETDDLVYFCDEVIKHADYVLSQTPEMLPVLKQAGVVDSGGQGLMQVLKGAYDILLGKEVDYAIEDVPTTSGVVKISAETEAEIKFGYCTEFIIVLNKPMSDKEELEYKAYLESIGDSIVVVADDEITKTHVHTNDPGLAIQKALTFGSLSKIKIDNMREEHQEKLIKDAEKIAEQQKEANTSADLSAAETAKADEPRKEIGFIAVSIGEGMNEIFRGLGVDYIIEGGQTMNPSTEDMLTAIENVNADNVFILPNNSNIIMAANQAATLVDDKEIIVIPTKTVPQGITAVVNFLPDLSVEENKETMLEEIQNVKTGQVTYAVRDTEMDGFEIKENDYMGIGDKTILAAGTDKKTVTLEMIDRMVDEDSAIVSIYFGSDSSEEEASELAEAIEEKYPDVEVEINDGGQPIYYYVISVE